MAKKSAAKKWQRRHIGQEAIPLGERSYFHESRGSITAVRWFNISDDPTSPINRIQIKIPWKTLLASARRCRPEEFAAK